jgi:hypothetical protein
VAIRCAASPKSLRPCSLVLTLKYPIAACIVRSPVDRLHDMPINVRSPLPSHIERLTAGQLQPVRMPNGLLRSGHAG